ARRGDEVADALAAQAAAKPGERALVPSLGRRVADAEARRDVVERFAVDVMALEDDALPGRKLLAGFRERFEGLRARGGPVAKLLRRARDADAVPRARARRLVERYVVRSLFAKRVDHRAAHGGPHV